MGAFVRFLSWILKKATFAVVLAVLGVASLGLWVFLRDHVDFDLRRADLIRQITGQTKKLRAALADVEARMAQMRVDIRSAEDRAEQAAKVAKEIESANSGFNRLTASSEQTKEDETRIARLKQMEAESRQKASDLQQALIRAQWEKDGLEIAIGKQQVVLKKVEEEKSKVVHYAREAWDRYGRTILIVAAIYFFGPPVGRLLLYFIVAPIISSRQPVRLGKPTEARPEVVTSRTSVDVALEPADTLWVKEKFLQASDEGLLKSTKSVLDWRMPFTCLAAGLVELIEMRNAAPEVKLRATFSSQEHAHIELAIVTVPAGASLVLRPTYLAGFIGPLGRRSAAIRRHWRLFSMQSWVTGQFRYFEFVGPCKLLVAGSRGVRAEVLDPVAGVTIPARRTNQDSTLGFTPGLAYRPVRAETFWAYFRGKNPLFDDLFEGSGVFLCQETSAKGESEQTRKFWAGLWGSLMRVFGL
jgi:hypothetical protein